MERSTMKLNDLDKKNIATKALKENFDIKFDVSGLDRAKTRAMLTKVTNLIKESKKSPDFYKTQSNATYLKLVFMEQALSQHMKVARSPKIVVESMEVAQSQVILAAQDMVDSIQKMYEDVNDMIVKELPALVNSIQSEIGANESSTFNQTVTDALNGLNTALQQAKTGLQEGLNGLTGQGSADAFGGGDSMDPSGDLGLGGDAGSDVDMQMGADGGGEELPPSPELDSDEADVALSSVGRSKR